MAAELSPRYDPAAVERRVYAEWERRRLFHAEPDTEKQRPPYCIVIPPPNVTAPLHLGHALNNTLQDVLVRYHRMCGDNTLWMPGTDHAGIATQTVVEKRILATEGKRRTEFAREDFVARIQAWKDEYEATITNQLKLMGCSCDWERQRFTMDAVCARAVRETFFRLFRDGLIYRGKRLVNWDPATQTVLADDEVEHEEVRGHFWYMQYPLVEPVEIDGRRVEHVTVATTRPETMLGDTAVAMNPADPRAKALVGKMVRLPIVGRIIPIIADEHVVLPNPESEDEKARFSTGFLKVTPAHDPDDYAIGQRHGLPVINVLAPDGGISYSHGWTDWDGIRNPDVDNLIGMDRFEAREAVIEWFRNEKLLEDVRDYVHEVGHSYRSHVPIEPYLSDQWYIALKKASAECGTRNAECRLRDAGQVEERDGVKYVKGTDVPVNSLAGLALAPLLDGRVKFVPDRYAKTYEAWVANLRDWPISRQLWWGHQIPVWAKTGLADPNNKAHLLLASQIEQWKTTGRIWDHWRRKNNETTGDIFSSDLVFYYLNVRSDGDRDVMLALEASGLFARDEDVLDTWFSSALWPFSTLGWPDDNAEMKTFYPGNVLCTAREIITLWVSRMVMMGQYCAGDIPFSDVFIHAMIQDGEGRKMSKSLGNGIDPLDIIQSHGADAMRFTLALMTTQTQDVRMPVEKIKLASGQEVNTSPKFDNGRNFCNKLWNAARFALMNLGEGAPCVDASQLAFEDRWILSRRNRVIEAVTGALQSYRFNDAAQAIYDFTWHDFCDWYLEIVKPRLSGGETAGQARAVLALTLDSVLRLLHPFMPFITEEIWQNLGRLAPVRGIGNGERASDSIMVASWPKPFSQLDAQGLEAEMTTVQDIIRAVRNIRSKTGINAREPLRALVSSKDEAVRAAIESNRAFLSHLANLSALETAEGMEKPPHSAAEVVGQAEVFVPLEGLIDLGAERARLSKKLEDVRGRLGSVDAKLGNESFVSRAPAEVVEKERAKAAELRAQAEALERNLAELE